MNRRTKARGTGPRFRRIRRGAGEPVNLNLAGPNELRALPGIGEREAERIVEWRHVHGWFRSIDQLREVGAFSDEGIARLLGQVRV